jgi:hypothetical protein
LDKRRQVLTSARHTMPACTTPLAQALTAPSCVVPAVSAALAQASNVSVSTNLQVRQVSNARRMAAASVGL